MSRATIAISSRGDQRTPEETLLEAGRQLIHTRGSSFTTQDVVSESGTSLYTFYRYFNGKDALILALLGQMIAEHCAGFELTRHRESTTRWHDWRTSSARCSSSPIRPRRSPQHGSSPPSTGGYTPDFLARSGR